MSTTPSLQKIIFFDGVCSLCNYWIDFLIKRDKNNRFLFAPLQGQTAQQKLSPQELASLSTIIYYNNGKTFYKSRAILKLLYDLGGFWKMTWGLQVIPRFISDSVYNWIANHRYKWFGKKETCRIPTAEERSKFLD